MFLNETEDISEFTARPAPVALSARVHIQGRLAVVSYGGKVSRLERPLYWSSRAVGANPPRTEPSVVLPPGECRFRQLPAPNPVRADEIGEIVCSKANLH